MERQTMIAKVEEALVRISGMQPSHTDVYVAKENLRLVLDGLRAEGEERIRLREDANEIAGSIFRRQRPPEGGR